MKLPKHTVVLLALIFLLSLIVISGTEPKIIFKKGAEFGNLNLRGKTFHEGTQLLKDELAKPIYLDLDQKSQAISLSEMGVTINEYELAKFTHSCKLPFLPIFCASAVENSPPKTDIININEETLESFLASYEKNLDFMRNNTIVSFEKKTFRALSPQAEIKIDRTPFENKGAILNLLGQEYSSVAMQIKTTDIPETQMYSMNNLISNMSYSMLIKYGRNKLYIPPSTVSSFIDTNTEDGLLVGKINRNNIQEYLIVLHEKYKTDDVQVIDKEAVDALERALLFRAANYEINNAVILPLEGKPKTNGELHDVYLEVIKSQQRLYRFEQGELVKTYIISTGLTWETPPGEYEVRGKQKMTISYYDEWYMPNYLWLGDINGYKFGFHAIPYHIDAGGNIYSRDPNTMGSPATGGCIQLTQEESLELFDWAEIGVPVYIYE